MPQDLNDDARRFLSSLYANPIAGAEADFDAAATRLVSRQGEAVVAGDQALQSLLFNFAVSTPENAERAATISAALAGIKQRAVNEFTRVFPDTNLDSLIESARNSGFDVQVLG